MAFSLFPALYDHPLKIRFVGQEVDETVELFLRQHWITIVPWLVLTLIAVILPVIFNQLNRSFNFVKLSQIPGEIVGGSLVLWYLLVAAYVIQQSIYWYFNIYIVTNKHLVDIDFFNLLSREVTEVRLDDVQSARARIAGIAGSLFNFGNVIIETAAKGQSIDFILVPRPDYVADRIQDLQDIQEKSVKIHPGGHHAG